MPSECVHAERRHTGGMCSCRNCFRLAFIFSLLFLVVIQKDIERNFHRRIGSNLCLPSFPSESHGEICFLHTWVFYGSMRSCEGAFLSLLGCLFHCLKSIHHWICPYHQSVRSLEAPGSFSTSAPSPISPFLSFLSLSLPLSCLSFFSSFIGAKNAAGLGLDDFLTDETVYSSTEEGRGGGRTRRRLLLSSGGSRIDAPYWLQGFTVSSLSGVFGGLGNLSAKALIEIIGSEGIYNCLRRYEFFLSLALTAFLCGLQLFFLNVALYR